MADDRPYDIVLFGATGFTGGLVADYLHRHVPESTRWAIAGRSQRKLDDVVARLDGDVATLVADVDDPASLRAIAEQTRVLVTTVGPYVLHGDAAVAACAAAGTDYLDLTGEPEFVDRTYARHHATARDTGARLVHAAGFDSVPHDLGAWFTVQHLPEDVPLTVDGYVRVSGSLSGGTLASALLAFSRPRQNVAAARARRRIEGDTSGGRRVHAGPGRPGRDPVDGGWALPMPTIDPQIVARSARAMARYGPDFTYTHSLSVPSVSTALVVPLGVGAAIGAAQLPPLRNAISRRLAPGQGPSEQRRAQSWFTVTFVGEGGGKRVHTRVAGRDPGYSETATMLGESALCLAGDTLPEVAGQVTTAQAMGNALIARLEHAGMRFELLP